MHICWVKRYNEETQKLETTHFSLKKSSKYYRKKIGMIFSSYVGSLFHDAVVPSIFSSPLIFFGIFVKSQMLKNYWTLCIKIKRFTWVIKQAGKIGFVVFGRSNMKNEIWLLQYISREQVKYWMPIWDPTPQNCAQKFKWYAFFS